MARTPKGTPPSYPGKPHKGQARITVRLIDGRRHDLLLGPFGSPESRAEYRRVLTELEAGGGRYRLNGQEAAASGLTVNELCFRFWKHAESHYRMADGSASRELDHYQSAQAVLVDLYGGTPAAEFGPLKLKAVRQKLVDTWRYFVRFGDDSQAWDRWVGESRFRRRVGHGGQWEAEWKGEWLPVELLQKKKALCRKVINQRIDHIRRMFKWAVSEELVPPAVYEALRAVAGLRRGHPGTYDKSKVKPVSQKHVEAVLPFLCPQVAAMVRLQPLLGPGRARFA